MIFFFLLSIHFLTIITSFAFLLLIIIIITNKDKVILITLRPYFLNPNLHNLLKNNKKLFLNLKLFK